MLEFCYSKYGSGLPQGLFDAILPFLGVAFLSLVLAPVFELLLRLALTITKREPVESGKSYGVGYMTSVALASLWIVCGWLGAGWVIWPFLAAIVLTTIYTLMLEWPPQRAMLPALLVTGAMLLLWGLALPFLPQ